MPAAMKRTKWCPAEMAQGLRNLSTMVPDDWSKLCQDSAAEIEKQTDAAAYFAMACVEREDKIIERFLRQALRDLKK
jgi:hypothetical protein